MKNVMKMMRPAIVLMIGFVLSLTMSVAAAYARPMAQDMKNIPAMQAEGAEKEKNAPNAKAKLNKLFREETPIKVTLHLPLNKIQYRNMGETGELPAKLIAYDEMGNPSNFDINVSIRGNTRQLKDICDFPPLKLNFKRKQVKNTIFAKQNKLKLVTYCKKSWKYKKYYLKEYLAYKIMNILTDYSFRARLLDITYLNEDGGGKPFVRTGFVIEDVDDLAARHGMLALDIKNIPSASLDPAQAGLVGMFQYFISNLDWSMIDAPGDENCCHNIKLLRAADGSGPNFPVPYDFDYSGLVDTPYALPPAILPVRNSKVTKRYYMGFCKFTEEAKNSLVLFNEKREEITKMVMDFTKLNELDRNRTVSFLDKFYETVNNPESLQTKVFKTCLGKARSK